MEFVAAYFAFYLLPFLSSLQALCLSELPIWGIADAYNSNPTENPEIMFSRALSLTSPAVLQNSRWQ